MKITTSTKIGWIGTGIMGCSMAGHLIDAGYSLSVFNRTRQKSQPLLDRGALWKNSPAEIAESADIVFMMVGLPRDVRDTALGSDGVLARLKSGGILVDMTTSSPSLAKEIADEAEKKGIVSLDAPVSGGDLGARNGTLSIMIGGDRQTADDLMPIWNCLGKTIVWQGPSGSGQHTKMVNQTLIAGTMIGLCEALIYASKAGLNLEKVLDSVGGGAAGSWSLTNLAPRILRGDFAPGFMIDHFLKDLGIVLEESRQMSLTLPGIELAHRLYATSQSHRLGRNGTQALALTLAELNGMELKKGEG